MLLVAFGWYGVFLFLPMIDTITVSLQSYNLFNPPLSKFVGLRNYTNLFGNDRFSAAVVNSLTYTILLYLLSVPAALLVSWCLANVRRGAALYQFIVFLPVVASLVAVSLLFRIIMNPETGALNMILTSLGLPRSSWIYGSGSAIYSLALVDAWKSLGFYVVLLTAAMLAVPPELKEAAKIDGAGEWIVFRHVTLPSIQPTLAVVSIFTVLSGLQVYVTPTVLGPGPGTSTLMMNEFIVEEAFSSTSFGGAAAVSVLLLLFMLTLTVIQLRVMRARS